MINKYSIWKNISVLMVLVIGFLYALPNIFGKDFAVQVSPERGYVVNTELLNKITSKFDENSIKLSSYSIEKGSLLMRFATQDEQSSAVELVQSTIGKGYISAINLAPKTPEWLQSLGGRPMNLGLDLRGGVYFLMEVDSNAAIAKKIDSYVSDFRFLVRKKRLGHPRIKKNSPTSISLSFKKLKNQEEFLRLAKRNFQGLKFTDSNENNIFNVIGSMNLQEVEDTKKFALEQNITTLRNRVNELGVSEPIIQQQGDNRIVVQLPGIQDTTRAKDVLGATATLDIRLVDEKNNAESAANSGLVPALSILRYTRSGRPVLMKKQVIVSGSSIIDAAAGFEQSNNTPAVFITLDSKGSKRMSKGTKNNIGMGMATVFVENKISSRIVDGKRIRKSTHTEEVINVATIQDHLSTRFQITGLDSIEEANDLAVLLKAGALAVPMEIIEERTVGPSLGADNIRQGELSVIVGMLLVLIFIVLYYKVFGLVANLALVFNIVLVVSLLSMMQAVLTLPGIAGIVLTVGMAVDANVLIFERIKEELKEGNTPQASIHAGYDRAFSTIMDANVTTLIAAVVLYAFGTGTIKGFAITLALGIMTSMFTSIVGTRAIINLIYGGKNIKKLSI